MIRWQQNMIYLFVALLVLGILLVLKPSHSFQPRGIILPLTQKPLIASPLSTASTRSVELFEYLPYQAKRLAMINIEAHADKPTKAKQTKVLEYAKQLALQAGANGLVIHTFGFEGASGGMPSALAKYILTADAIYS